ncbi:MAG TPA: sigma-70 family RNA polymerase sigma factor [Gemmatimonadaceae bacterium]|nr:sigma-70 family RNA polymerase sigma factor [Gemmatimonadaceae bacterium]
MNPPTHDATYPSQTMHGVAIDDAAIVSRMANGDEAALAVLYDRWMQAVYSLAMHLLRDADEAEDVVEETFWQAWQRAATFDATRGTVRSWLLMIGRSRALDRLRARQRQRDEIVKDSDQLLSVAADSDPLLDAEGAERRTLVLQALQELPDDQRRALELAYFRGLSQTEVAEFLGEPLGTIKTRMRLGMQKLRNKLFTLREETA